MIVDLTAVAHPGLYVVEFPGQGLFPQRIKIGRSDNPLARVAAHGGDGATRGWISTPVRDLVGAEHLALGLAAELLRDRPAATWESFSGASFEEVVKIVGEAACRFALPERAA